MRSDTKYRDGGGTLEAAPAPVAGPSGPARYLAGTPVDVWPTPDNCSKFTHFAVQKQGEAAQTVYVEPVTVTMTKAATVTGYFSDMSLYGDFEAMLAFFYPNALTRPATGTFDVNGYLAGGTLTPDGIPDAAEFGYCRDRLLNRMKYVP